MPLFCFIIFTQKEKKIKKHILLLFQFKIYNCTKLVISLLFSDSIISYQKNQGSVGKHKRGKILKKKFHDRELQLFKSPVKLFF